MASPRLDSETLPVITKHITQDVINQFEACGILNRANIHNDPNWRPGASAPPTPSPRAA